MGSEIDLLANYPRTKRNLEDRAQSKTEDDRERMLAWNLTGLTIMHVDEWKAFFREAGYTGDYFWFIP